MKRVFLLLLLVFSVSGNANAKMLMLLAPEKEVGGGGGGAPAPTFTDPNPVCNPAPTISDIQGNYEYHDTLMTSSEAGKVGITLGGLSGSGTQLLYIKDYLRGKECLATDGKTKLLYGQSIRTVISLSDWDSKFNASYSIIAADATINHKNHQLHLFSYGIDNADINTLIGNISNKTFDVDTYSDYSKIESEIIKLIPKPATNNKVERLAVVQD